MNRRRLLGLATIGLLGLWALRPSDRGEPHARYFARLDHLLQREGGGTAQLIVDLQRLDANAGLLARRLADRLSLRLVVKSLAATGLLEYLSGKLDTQRFMVFTPPQLQQLAQAFPGADLLLGKPLPAAAALDFYQQLPRRSGFDPARQLTWLIDSPARLAAYAQLAQALGQSLRIAFEIDIGMARGGFANANALGQALHWLRDQPALQVRGLMGYDAQVAQPPWWIGQDQAFARSVARYRSFIAAAERFADIWPRQPLLNGAGSLTHVLHTTGNSPLNELAIGSALLKPGDFDTPLLSDFQPALWIASPALKIETGELPFLADAQPLLQSWNRNRQQAVYLDGGDWPATPVSPAGLNYDPLYSRSSNQERLIGSSNIGLAVNDWVFLRPARSERLLGAFDHLRLLRHGRLVGRWTVPGQR